MGKETDDDIGDEKAALAMLSDAERAAMMEDAEDDAAAAKKVAGDDEGDDDQDDSKKPAAAAKPDAEDDPDDEDGDDEDDDKGDAAAKAAQDAADSAAAAAAEAAKAAEKTTQHEPIKLDLTPIDANYSRALEELDGVKAVKFKEMMDGVIDVEEYSKFESKYLRDRDAAAAERNDTVAWFKEVNAFQNEVLKADGINYATDTKMNAAFDRWVKALAADPENAQKDGSWFLKEAHDMVKTQYRVGDQKPAPSDKPGKDAAKPAKPAGRAPDTSNLPKTLGRLPAAAEAETGDEGEFAHIEKLTGIERERALARMTPEQEDRYLRS